MTTEKKFNKKLEYLPLGQLVIIDNLKSLSTWDRDSERAIKISIEERGNHTSYTAVKFDDSHALIDGRLCHQIELELFGADHIVPVWILEGEYSEEDIQQYLFDLDKRRKKSLTHIMDEFEFIDARLPNNQGKKNAENYRKNEIARRIGVSSSKIDQVKRLNAAAPYLLRAVDVGDMSLKKAMAEANLKEKLLEEQEMNSSFDEPVHTTREISATNQHVDLNAVMTDCPCCGLPFDRIQWTDVPNIFNYKRKENEKQTDWLEAVA